ncbi:hypothetical protein QTG54_014882 [Skeletonema marinoi]|uniref:Uncharacterized protein n=1 Tax=Skeletonema marinoi TaxID=267567 RepID=A0AAD8XVQ6_9STRA|nr:hypothetical protein QTG54_014882 [Skeletonema marinoi]
MAFPEEAVYGTLDQSALPQQQRQWDGRDDTSSAPQTPTSNDDDYQDLVHIASRDDEGNPCAEIEVTRTIAIKRSTSMVDQHLHSRRSTSHEELSPHIDTATNNEHPPGVVSFVKDAPPPLPSSPTKSSPLPPQLPLSPSANSIGTDFSATDIEHKLEHEANTVKHWLVKVKSDRDRYKHERNILQAKVDVANEQRTQEVNKVQTELEALKEKADEQITILLEDLHSSKVQLQELTKAGGGANEEMKQQLDMIKAKLTLAEEALDKEKSSSSTREATKVEEARQAQFEQFKVQITELEDKFKVDLAEVRVQKQMEVQSLQAELGTAKGVQEHLACQVEEREEELKNVKGAFDALSKEHEECPTVLAMEEAVQTVRDEMKEAMERVEAEKEGLAGQLEAKHMELVQVKGEYTNEHDRMKEQLANLTNLVDTKTTDLTKSHEMTTSLQRELCASKMETTMAMETMTALSEENFKLKQEAEAMSQTRLQYEQREQERKAEVLRLHAKLEEIHSLVPSPSQDSSKDGNTAVVKAEGVCATVPDLDDGAETTCLVAVDNVHELEDTRKKLKIVEVERDIIKAQMEDMKKFPPFTTSSPKTKSDQIVADLEEKLKKAEKLYVDVAVENSELKAKLGSPKNEKTGESTSNDESLASELKSIKAAILIKNAEIATLKRKVSLKENEQKPPMENTNDTVEEATKLKDGVIWEIANLLDDKQQLPVTVANESTEIAADVPAGIILGNDIDDIKQEHRVEVKLLMEKHASLKTQIQLLTKQKEQIASAYECEQTCCAELESSLQDMVALLEDERSMHSGKMNELKVIKHKFSKLKKKRVPVDAAYKASLKLLEQLERKKTASQTNGEIEKVMKAAIDLINSLTLVVEKENSSDLSPASPEDSLPDDKHTKALSEACEKLELGVMSIKMQLSTKTAEYDELLKSKTDDDAMHQEAVAVLKQQLAEFSESAATFEETVATYKNRICEAEEKNASLQEQLSVLEEESLPQPDGKELASVIQLEVAQQEKNALKQQLKDAETKYQALEEEKIELVGEVTRAKESNETTQQEKESLDQQLQHAGMRVDELLGLIQEMRDAQSLNGDAKKAYEEKHDELQDLAQKYESLQIENEKLIDEVQAKEILEEALAEFEQTLTVTCESHEKALREKQEECKGLNEQLDRVTMELADFKDSCRPEKELDSSKEIALLGKVRKELSAARLSNDKKGEIASEHELDEHLRNLDKNLLAEAIKQEVMQHENDSLKQQIQDVETKCQALEEEKNKLVGEVNRAKESFEQVIAEFEEELNGTCASEQALSEKQEECKELIEQLGRLKEELSDSKETSLQEITRLTDMTSTDKASLEELQKESQRNEKLLEELREELADSEESERTLQDVVALHEASIEALKKELDTATTKVAELPKLIHQVEAFKSESQGKIDEVTKELEDTKKALKESVEVCMQQRSEIAQKDALARENKSLAEKLQLLSKAKLDLESEAANHDQAISMIEHELKTTRSEITLKNRQIQIAQEEKQKAKHQLDMAMKSMEEVFGSLQEQGRAMESEKAMDRAKYEKDVQLQRQEVEALQKKHSAAMSDLDSLSELISNLKASLESEKENSKVLLAQFNESEENRKAQTKQKAELEEELAATMQSVDALTEQISCLEADLAVALTEEEERELKETLSSQEQELTELRAKIDSIETSRKNLQDEFQSSIHKKEEESTKLRIILQEARDKLSRLHAENEKLRNENSDAVNSMSEMLNDAVRGRAEVEMSLQESIHLLEQQKRMDIKKNSQMSKMEHEVQILQTKERYQETLIASLKNQIKRGM